MSPVFCCADVVYFLGSQERSARALAISPEAVFLGAEEVLPEGTMLTLRLRLPGVARAFTALGRVFSVVLDGAGLRRGMSIAFLDIAPRDREAIRSWAADRPALPPPSGGAAPGEM
jgi:hypothetical protein